MKIELVRKINAWEQAKVERERTEREFNKYSGLLDVFELHIPYTHYEYLTDAFEKASKYKGKRTCVFSDVLNMDMFSVFYARSSQKSLPTDELKAFINLLHIANEIYDHIIFLQSNHDKRLNKILRYGNLQKDQADEVQKFLYTYDDIFANEKLPVICVDHYLVQIGDVIVAHLENNSSVPGSLDRWVVQYLTPRIKKEWNVCYQQHSHCQSRIAIDRKLVIETGALCETMDYWRDGKMKGKGKMSTVGYGQSVLKDGKADVNSSNFVICGWEGWL